MPIAAPEVIVIGSGAGGAASAWALVQQGIDVLLLEAGPRYDPFQDYLLHTDGWERQRFPHKSSPRDRYAVAPLQALDANARELYSWNGQYGRLVPGDRRANWGYHHVQGVGGSTLHFTGEAHRMHPQAMQMRSRFGVGADWPLTYQELEPSYQAAEDLIGIAGADSNAAWPRAADTKQPAHPLSFASQKIRDGGQTLGMRWVPNSLAALSRPFDGRPACNYCANCNRGCPRMDKGSADVTFVRHALASGRLTMRTDCSVARIETGDGDRVNGVVYFNAEGVEHRVKAKTVILACGAVETPRLLLLSENRDAPDGLCNDDGQLGLHFMETLAWIASALHPEPLASYRGLPADAICWDYNAPDAIASVIGGCRFSTGVAEAELNGPVNHARRVAGGWGTAHKRRMRETFGHVLTVVGVGEDLSNSGTFIDLDPDETDRYGLLKARIHSRVDAAEIERLRFMAGKTREILAAAGGAELVEEYGTYDNFNATHVFGGCRMGDDPATSVVNRDCRSHRWKNLWISDASVFPSSGGGEAPSLTIEALAIRTAQIIAKQAG